VECAARLIGVAQQKAVSVPSATEVSALRSDADLGWVTCLSEAKYDRFVAAVKADCQFYALTSSILHSTTKFKLRDLGPLVGSALFDGKWHDEDSGPYHIADAATVGAALRVGPHWPNIVPDVEGMPHRCWPIEVPPEDKLRRITCTASADLVMGSRGKLLIYVYAVRPATADARRAAKVGFPKNDRCWLFF
jgi:hypothetical protein